MVPYWQIPEGLRVLPDGAWRVGDFPIVHARSLRQLKAHLFFDADGAFLSDGARRMPVRVEGPPFEVIGLVLDHKAGQARAILDDGSMETLAGGSLWMDDATGRFECAARGGRSRAVFSRAAHQILLDNVVEEAGAFHLRVGDRRISITT